jgi:hypothetical protein
VISFNAVGFAYITGLIKPTALFFALILCSLIREMMDPTVGAAAEVPKTRYSAPFAATTKLAPLAEMSG